jgi:hypothetical protein
MIGEMSPEERTRRYKSTAEMIRDLGTAELTRRYADILGQYDRTVLHDDEEADQRLAEVSDTLIETARELIGRLQPPPPVTRPDGRIYRPRTMTAHAVTDPDDGDTLSGVVVLGTHDPGAAQPLADAYAAWQLGRGHVAVSPVAVWWRDGFTYGRRGWVTDEKHGRAGTWFRSIVEAP